MLAHDIKDVLVVVPEAIGFIKKASLEQDFPVDNKDSAAASYLTAAYMIKVAGKVLDVDLLARLEKAASLYGVKRDMDKMIAKFQPMIKQASEEEVNQMVKVAEASFEGDLAGFLNIEAATEKAEELLSKYAERITSEHVKRYGGQAYLNKEAAVMSLANRFYATKEKEVAFVKIARLVNDSVRENDFATIHELCGIVAKLDKQAGLDLIGFNPYKEFLLTKKSEVATVIGVNLNGQKVPYEKIMRLGKDRIGSYLGKDVAAAMTDCPVNNKAVLEALPRDSQAMLLNVLKNV